MVSGMSASSAEISRTMLVEDASERSCIFFVKSSKPSIPSLQILKVEEGEIYSPASCIHAVTDFPVRCLNAALKVL